MDLLDDDEAEKLLQRPVAKDDAATAGGLPQETGIAAGKGSPDNFNDDSWEPINTSEWVSGGNPDKDTKSKTDRLKKKIEDHQAKSAKSAAPISVDNTEAGIRLTIQNLQFKADSSELLPGEEKRLDQIAEILKLAEGAQFLIEGHTASTGYEAGEMKLSKERADSIAAALAKRGIGSERFICKGSGGKKPIASNETAEGKAMNRRVEITILD
jgi:outer membrane protein OmpA-like peptidoglycan-associated protein